MEGRRKSLSTEIRIAAACISARLTGWLIDAAITIGIMAVAMHVLADTMDVQEFILQSTYGQLAIVLLAPYSFHVYMLGTTDRTLGMYAVDTQVLETNGELPTWNQAFRRPLGLIPLMASGGLLGLAPLLNEHRRGTGDWASGTRVVESLAMGRKVSYDTWRIFKALIKPMGPICLAICIAVLLIQNNGDVRNKDVFIDALVLASILTLAVTTLIAAIKVKTTRVRFTPFGILRSGWFGWANVVPWDEMETFIIKNNRHYPHLIVRKSNNKAFRVPLEMHQSQFAMEQLAINGVRVEQ